jgi:transposase
MRVLDVLLKAMSGEINWLRAADIIGIRPRTMRRLRARYERYGCDGLVDRRRQTPSPRRAPLSEVQHVLQLYRQRYAGFNVRHFHQMATERHGVKLSYTLVKTALQGAGLVKKRRPRGRHRLRRDPRACFGEMLHIDGSEHAWLALRPAEKQTLIPIIDDATSRVLYAQLCESESVRTVMTALREVILEHGLPMALYSDRASWAFFTPRGDQPRDPKQRTQVGRALEQLGIEQILANSPQARGRSERLNGTLQDRLVNELKLERIRTVDAANRYLREHFIADHNRRYSRLPREADSAFVPLGNADIDQILCVQENRTVARDNTVTYGKLHLQILKQRGRVSCAHRAVQVRQHLDGHISLWLGRQNIGCYDAQGRPLTAASSAAANAAKPPTSSAARPGIERCASRARGLRRAAAAKTRRAA